MAKKKKGALSATDLFMSLLGLAVLALIVLLVLMLFGVGK